MNTVLPPSFPLRMTETDRHKVQWFYQRYVEEYYDPYRFGHFILAAYASVPALITPDLLYKIWLNFHAYRWGNEPASIHRIAVADFLLSPLCREVGYELYEMHTEIREAFWEWLSIESKTPIWQKRGLKTPAEIADFLIEYQSKPNPGHQRWGEGYGEVQDFAVYFSKGEYQKLEQMLGKRLKQALEDNRKVDALRILDIWAKQGKQLTNNKHINGSEASRFSQNAATAEAIKAIWQENPQGFLDRYGTESALLSELDQGGIQVEVPLELVEHVDAIAKVEAPAQIMLRYDNENKEWRLYAGSNQGLRPSLSFFPTIIRLNGGREYEVMKVSANHATLEAFEEGDIKKVFQASVIQIAPPGVKLTFAPDLNQSMADQLYALLTERGRELDHLEWTDNQSEALYFVSNLEDRFYLEDARNRNLNLSVESRALTEPEGNPQDFMEQVHKIAKWTIVRDLEIQAAGMADDALKIQIHKIENEEFASFEQLENMPATLIPEGEPLEFRYGYKNGKWLQPAMRCRFKNQDKSILYAHVFYLQSDFAILQMKTVRISLGEEEWLQFENRSKVVNTIPFLIQKDSGEIQTYLKIFVSETPLDLDAFKQEAIDKSLLGLRSSYMENNAVRIDMANCFGKLLPIKIIKTTEGKSDENNAYQHNEILINRLFEALIPYHEDIRKMAERERAGENIIVAKRRMALLNALPVILAENLRRLMVPVESEGSDASKPTIARLLQVKRAYLQSTQWISFIALAELKRHKEFNPSFQLAEGLKAVVNVIIQDGITTWQEPVKVILKELTTAGAPFFLPDISDFYAALTEKKDLQSAITFLENLNPESVSSEEVASLNQRAEEALTLFLCSLAFSSRHRLTSIHNVSVNSTRSPMTFSHTLIALHDMLGGFDSHQLTLPNALPNRSILLIEEENWTFLDLSPFVVDQVAYENTAGITKLYLFDGSMPAANSYRYRYVNRPEDPILEVNAQNWPELSERIQQFRSALNEAPVQEAPPITGNSLVENIKTLVAEDELAQALDLLREVGKSQNLNIDNELIIIQGNLKQIEKAQINGLINFEEYQKGRNRTRQSLLDLLKTIDKSREKVIGTEDNLLKINWLEKALKASKSVCRLVVNPSGELATGFITKDGYLFTVNHALSTSDEAKDALIEFNFEADEQGKAKTKVSYKLDPSDFITSIPSEFDYTRVKVIDNPENPLSQWGYVEFETNNIPTVGESVTIIQHPRGEDKKIGLNANDVLGQMNQYLFYETDTEPGSSGAPVFNADWKVVAMHHAAKRDPRDGMVINAAGEKRPAGRGILFREIFRNIETHSAGKTQNPETKNPVMEEAPAPPPSVSPQPSSVPHFITLYDIADEDKCALLNKHLSALKRTKKLTMYNVHSDALPGFDPLEKAREALNKANYILVLLSVNFFNNNADWFDLAINAVNESKNVSVIYLNRTDIEGTGLEKMPRLPQSKPSLADFSNADEGFEEIVMGIKRLVAGQPLI